MAHPRFIAYCAVAVAGLWLGARAVPWSGAAAPTTGRDANRPPSVTVFAAASATDALSEIAAMYQRRRGVSVRLSFASSSTAARQIAAGAAADVFLSANPRWMDCLETAGLLRSQTRRDLLTNRLALVAPLGKGFAVKMTPQFDLAGAFAGRAALGDPEHVPAGMYAEQALQRLGWRAELLPRLIPCQNVRMALAAVELQEAAVGIVYASDAQASKKVETLAVFPQDSHDPIRYPAAICRGAVAEADDFFAFLCGPEAAAVFQRRGFAPLASAGGPPDKGKGGADDVVRP